ncbi:MAG TPA: MMPL family transporter [Thermoleophilaceae bacterium]|nr:MMPL family transporter [Thermoleophilaceae bacterium]
MFDALAGLADRRGKLVVVLAVLFFAVAGAVGGGVADKLHPYGADDPDSETYEAREKLREAGHRATSVVVLIDGKVESPRTERRVAQIQAQLQEDPDVASVAGVGTTRQLDFVAEDGSAQYLAVTLKPTDDKEWQAAAERIADDLAGTPGVKVGGPALAQAQVNDQVEADLQRAEMLAFPLLFLLSLLFFRSLVAAALPLLVGGLAIVGTFLTLSIASELGSISIFALNLTTGLGLGLAIDYSLFVVSRYREEIAKDGPGLAAMRRTMATAGRTVLFSSLTVAAALASLLVFPQRFLYSMGLGGAAVALLAAAVSLIVLPAVLTLLGNRVNAGAPKFLQRRAEADARPDSAGFWYRLSRFVQRIPGRIAIAATVLMLTLGIPFWSIEFTSVDAQVLPQDKSARQVDDVLRSDFPPFRDTPIDVLVSGADSDPRKIAAVSEQIARLQGIDRIFAPTALESGDTLIQAISATPHISEASQETVREIRGLDPPPGVTVQVTGGTADFIDFQSSLVDHLPTAVAIVVIATLLILFLMTGSVVLPLKALLMNVLNLSAVFGILVFIFQDGRLEGLLDYTSQGALEQTMPVLLFAVAFGLSTDYAVFLLSRIKEARDKGASDTDSVAIGLERTGRIVTAAALLFAIAIGAFATSEIIFIKQNGIGTALAVLLDATIIRALLVPSLMELLGRWNWWAPRPLRRLHDRFGLSETPTGEPRPAEA